MATKGKFDVEVKFTGLCAFVPDDELARAMKLCVVLVNGTGLDVLTQARKALDKKELRFHQGIVRIPYANLSPRVPVPEAPDVLWYIKPGTRISFTTRPAAASQGNLQFDLKKATKDNPTSFGYVAAMEQILDQPRDIDPDALSPSPSDRILAQVLFRGGTVRTTKLPKTIWKYLPQVKTTPSPPTPLAHGVSVFFSDVTQATMVVTDIASGKRRPVRLKSDPDGKARVRISNMCRDNPLEWELLDAAVTDVDVRWYYELLDEPSKRALRKLLTKDGLPLPVPQSAGAGPDCSPHTFDPADFYELAKAEYGSKARHG